MNILPDRGFLKILVLAVFLRLLLMPFFLHPDIKTYHFQSSFLGDGVVDIYTYLAQKRETLPLKDEFVYFPLTYYFLGTYQIIVSPFLGDSFKGWLYDASQSSSERIGVFRYLFILKLPYLVLDVGIAFLIMGFFKELPLRRRAFILWLFNPFSLILIYVFSNVDVIPVFLGLLGLRFFNRERYIKSGFLIGVAACFKGFPLLYAPFLLTKVNSLNKRVLFFCSSFGVFALALILSWSEAFKQASLVSGLTTRVLYAKLDLGLGESVLIFVTSYVFLFLAVLTDIICKKETVKLLVILLIALFSLIHFHIHWLLWVLPFAVILVVTKPKLIGLMTLWIGLGMAIPMLYNDKAMSIGLLMPISHLFDQLPALFQVAGRIYEPVILQSLFHSALAGMGAILIWKILQTDRG